MTKAVLLTLLLAPVLIPIWTARARCAHRGLRRTVLYICVFQFLYVLAVVALLKPE